MPKIKSDNTSTAVANEAATFAKEAEQREADYRQARERDVEARKAHTVAVAEVARVERAAAVDLSSITADDLLRAEAARLAEIGVQAAAAALSAAERKRVSTDVSLAQALVDFTASVLGVVPTVSPFRPTEVPNDLPSAVLVQTKAATHDRRSGRLSGEVELRYTRTGLHRQAEAGAFERAAEQPKHGAMLSSGTSTRTEDDGTVLVDVVRLPVYGVLPAVPEVAISDAQAVAHEVAVEIAHKVALANEYTISAGTPRTGLDTGRRLAVLTEATAARVIADSRDGDVRRLTVEATVKAKPGTSLSEDMRKTYTVSRCLTELAAAVESLGGHALAKVGRITEATVTSTDVEDGPRGQSVAALATMRVVIAVRVPAVVADPYHSDDDHEDEDQDHGTARNPRDMDPLASHPGSLA